MLKLRKHISNDQERAVWFDMLARRSGRPTSHLVTSQIVRLLGRVVIRVVLKLQERVDLKPEQRYRLVGIGLSNFCDPEDMLDQRTLFD